MPVARQPTLGSAAEQVEGGSINDLTYHFPPLNPHLFFAAASR